MIVSVTCSLMTCAILSPHFTLRRHIEAVGWNGGAVLFGVLVLCRSFHR